jgi:radical SAM/Cys-rich protein
MCAPASQVRILAEVGLPNGRADFATALAQAGQPDLIARAPQTLQLNLGKLCNMTCRHCHVDAGPDRVDETMAGETVEACLRLAERSDVHTVDLTGGAPELNPNFEVLVERAAGLGKHVIDRCNLTVLLLPRFSDLPAFLARHGVEVVCSLPHWRVRNTDAMRGAGTFARSIEAMRLLNAVGYGRGDPGRRLTLMTNPAGAFLSGDQRAMEGEWKEGLNREHGVTFDRLIALNNMPIARFFEWLVNTGNLGPYLARLVGAFNPATVQGLMCRDTISVGWDGRVYDCDFNQMLELEARYDDGTPCSLEHLSLERFGRRRIRTAAHCFGCTAGAGSSCGGSTSA